MDGRELERCQSPLGRHRDTHRARTEDRNELPSDRIRFTGIARWAQRGLGRVLRQARGDALRRLGAQRVESGADVVNEDIGTLESDRQSNQSVRNSLCIEPMKIRTTVRGNYETLDSAPADADPKSLQRVHKLSCLLELPVFQIEAEQSRASKK